MRINPKVRALAALPVLALIFTACGVGDNGVNSDYLQLSKLEQVECTPTNVVAVNADIKEAAAYVADLSKDTSAREFEDVLVLNPGQTDLTALETAIEAKQTECAAIVAAPASSATSTPSVAPTLSEKEVVIGEAQQWVRQMTANFEGVTTLPEECVEATFAVDLTTPEFYRDRGGKETAGAFGPSIGTNPCEVSRNRVERYFRDSSLLVTKINELAAIPKSGISAVKEADVAKLHNGPYQDRLELARPVLAWYTSSERVLSIVKKDGPYTSNTMKGDGTTTTSYGNKPSDVIETRDRTTGKVIKGDRINCGDQNFVPGIPKGFNPPKPGQEITKLDRKLVRYHPANTEDTSGESWNPAAEEDDNDNTSAGGGTAPKTYTPAPKPSPTPTPRSTPPPPPPPSPEPTEPIPTPTTGCDPNNPLCDSKGG